MTIAILANWWSLVLRGLFGIAFGIFAFFRPAISLSAIILLFGIYAFLDGVLSLAGTVRAARAHKRWAALLLEGMAGVIAGAVTLLWPALTATVLILLVAAWAILSGILEINAAIRLRQVIQGEWLLAVFGVLSILFGILVASVPLAGAIVLMLWIGAFAFVSGILKLALGFRLRRWTARASDFRIAA